MGDEPDLDPEISRSFFEGNVLKLDPSLLTENGIRLVNTERAFALRFVLFWKWNVARGNFPLIIEDTPDCCIVNFDSWCYAKMGMVSYTTVLMMFLCAYLTWCKHSRKFVSFSICEMLIVEAPCMGVNVHVTRLRIAIADQRKSLVPKP